MFSTLNVTAWYPNWLNDLKDQFELTFIDGKRYKQLITGFQNTLKITFGALLIGIVIGIVIAAVRSTYDKNAEKLRKKGGATYYSAYSMRFASFTLPSFAERLLWFSL